MRKQVSKTLLTLAAGLAFLLPTTSAMSCETVVYHPTPVELTQDARAFYEQEAFIYEGVLLGAHDYKSGGLFLVIKIYKGPAKPFTVLKLPGGSSCYNDDVAPFSVGFWSDYATSPNSFDGFVNRDYVESWKRQGLVDDSVLTVSHLVVGLLLLLTIVPAGLIVSGRRKRRQNLK